jgi:hypothetical protein
MQSSLASLRASYETNLRPRFGGGLLSRSAKLVEEGERADQSMPRLVISRMPTESLRAISR